MTGWDAALRYAGVIMICAPTVMNAVRFLTHRVERAGGTFVTICGCVVMAVANAIGGEWGWTALFAAYAVILAGLWWWHRRKRRHVPKLIGEKARAIRASLVKTMRERAKPRHVLRPVPGGAA